MDPYGNEFQIISVGGNVSEYMEKYTPHPIGANYGGVKNNAPPPTGFTTLQQAQQLTAGHGPPARQFFIIEEIQPRAACGNCSQSPPAMLPNHAVPPPPEKPVCHTEPRWPGGNPGTITPPPPIKTVKPTPPSEMWYMPEKHVEPPCDTVYRWPAGNKELKCCTPEIRQAKYENRYRATCRCRETERKNKLGGAPEIVIQPSLPQMVCTESEPARPNFNCNYGFDKNLYSNKPVAPAKPGFRCPDTCKDKIHPTDQNVGATNLPTNQNVEEIHFVIIPGNQNILQQKPSALPVKQDLPPLLPAARNAKQAVKKHNPKAPCKCKRLSSFDYCSQW